MKDPRPYSLIPSHKKIVHFVREVKRLEGKGCGFVFSFESINPEIIEKDKKERTNVEDKLQKNLAFPLMTYQPN